MAARRVPAQGALVLKCSEDDLAANRHSCLSLRFAAKIPAGMAPGDALLSFSQSVGAMLKSLPCEDGGQVSVQRPFVGKGRDGLPYSVCFPIVVPPELGNALLARRDPRAWLPLPAPWGAPAALFAGDTAEQLQVVHLHGLPVGVDPSLLQSKLAGAGFQLTEMQPLTDTVTGYPLADAVSALVPIGTRFPEEGISLTGPDGQQLATIKIYYISRLPPAHSYAAAAAGTTRPTQPSPPTRPAQPGGSTVAPRPAARQQQQPTPSERVQLAAKQQAARAARPSGVGSGGSGATASPTTQPQQQSRPQRERSADPVEDADAASKRQRSAINRFSLLTDQDAMDAGPAALLQQGGEAAAGDTDMTDGRHGSAT
jgi:hypothetical protein